MIVTTPFETTPLIITEELYTPPLRPTQLITPSSTSPLQYPASPIVSPEVEAAVRLTHLANPLPPLETLTQLASLAPPSSSLENNILGLTTDQRSLSPLLLPPLFTNNPDSADTLNTRPSESLSAQTFGTHSPSYHVWSPSPSPTLSPASSPPPPSRPSSAPPNTTLPGLPTVEETRLENQENCPPTAALPHIPDPYAPPLCSQQEHQYHPHQFFIVQRDSTETWHPIAEAQCSSLLEFLTVTQILQDPPAFALVLSFKGYSHHTSTIIPTDAYQAGLFSIPTLTTCADAGLSEPTVDVPLGYIHYSFRALVKRLFTPFPLYTHLCFTGALVISEVHDFLNGHRIFTYGFLHFDSPNIYISDQAYYFDNRCSYFS